VSTAEWTLRSVRNTRKDRKSLSAFACADLPIPWQAEVEDFVQTQLFDWRYAPLAQANDPRALLLFHARTKALIGVAAHERMVLQAGIDSFHATKLEIIALANDWQGRAFTTGDRASDVLMSAVMTDITARVPPRFARVLAVVHEANDRSIRLCRRYGFTDELSRSDELSQYRRLLTAHR
jgi:hypothetical protein